ncbi:hypothetical protein HJC23_010644 [Cyclotella cryptica]|uniref:Uncharacterized protein n=1 Tax=Cyclotella cryptica TaxID=29204 RepID=A0ABD3PGI1_9STRA|eukprot:CCRYP_014843-RA/>CCRYP_014843-RA protein AED:0.27 eAED:0.27 QI:0/-1/0/1/-1/1/1/0/128
MNFAAATRILAALTARNGLMEDVPCETETTAVLTCLDTKGDDDCLPCLFDAIFQIDEDATCEDIANSSFCADITNCATNVCDADCGPQWTAAGECLEKYAAENVDQSEVCDGLCETEVEGAFLMMAQF